MTHLANQEHRPGGIGGEVQLLGPDIDITREDIVHDDVLHKGAPVVLFLIEPLGIAEGDVSHGAEALGNFVVTGAEHGVLESIGAAHNGLEALLAKGNHIVTGIAHLQGGIAPALAQQGGVGAGDHAALGINDAEGVVGDISQLNNYTLENTVGHMAASLVSCINAHFIKL